MVKYPHNPPTDVLQEVVTAAAAAVPTILQRVVVVVTISHGNNLATEEDLDYLQEMPLPEDRAINKIRAEGVVEEEEATAMS